MSQPPNRRTSGDSLDCAAGHALSPRLQRALRSDVDLIWCGAIRQGARVQGVEYVAHGALRAVEGLTEMETLALRRAPLGEARYQAIVDTATSALARIVAETGQL